MRRSGVYGGSCDDAIAIFSFSLSDAQRLPAGNPN
jgi:hypothetical protein